LLSACGDSGSESEEGQIEEVIVASATNTDPAKCEELNTQKFIEQLAQSDGAAAVKECEEEAEDDEGADSVSVSAIAIDGESATADVAVTGGGFDGQSLEIGLVKEGGEWKVDEFVKFTDLDQEKLVRVFEREAKASGELDDELVACFVDAFEEATQAEIEDFLLSGSPRELELVAEACLAESRQS